MIKSLFSISTKQSSLKLIIDLVPICTWGWNPSSYHRLTLLYIFVFIQLCEKITGGNPILTDICEGLVEAKLPDIIEYLVNGLPPYEICQTITGDCPDDVTSTTTTPIPPGKI